MEKITKLLSAKVVNEEGMYLGRVIDLRSAGDPEHGIRHKDRKVSEILYGTKGLLQMLGIRQTKTSLIPWKAVKKFDRGRIVVNTSDIE
jgi:sporulation protein YlmC with PRC-barrel domain